MDKIHRAGVIHHDIKLGNIMVNARSPDFKFYEVQLIDWNIAVMFFKGFDGNGKSGTKCYYSPEQLMGAAHVTPAMDIFSLGVMIYAYLADSKPYIANCSQDNLQAVGSLVGERRLLEVFEKYNYHCNDCMELFAKLEGKIDMYKPRSF
jgi:serine/threonine protein kinase